MPCGLKRYYGKGHLHFLTFSCYQRRPFFKSVHARQVFVRELERVRRKAGFRLLGYVVMPEHVHLLMSEPPQGTPCTVMHDLKLRVAKKLRGERKKCIDRGSGRATVRTVLGSAEFLAGAFLRFQRVHRG